MSKFPGPASCIGSGTISWVRHGITIVAVILIGVAVTMNGLE